LACSVCLAANENALAAFYGTAVFLSVMPFVLIGGIVFWLYRRVKAREQTINGSQGHTSQDAAVADDMSARRSRSADCRSNLRT
jgi:hypothetical protein